MKPLAYLSLYGVMERQGLEISPPLSTDSSNDFKMNYALCSAPNTPILPASPPSPERMFLQPEDSNGFLTALAGQERRILELREELERAELELQRLKKQWASHETSKKKNELRHVERLRPISKSVSSTNPLEAYSLPSIGAERNRRKLPSISTKQSQRKVFSGSKHTRALSLLSPKSSTNQPMMPPPTGTMIKGSQRASKSILGSTTEPEGASMATNPSESAHTPFHKTVNNQPKDAILETGKQLVGDFRIGLWTFFEDLKQATVGDEIMDNPSSRNIPGRHLHMAGKSEKGPKHNSMYGASKTRNETATRLPPAPNNGNPKFNGARAGRMMGSPEAEDSRGRPILPSPKPKSVSPNSAYTSNSDDDGWDNWDSPKPKCSVPYCSSASLSVETDKSSPRTSIRWVSVTTFALIISVG